MTLDDYELLKFHIFSEFFTTSHFWVNRCLLVTVWLWRLRIDGFYTDIAPA